MLTILSPAKNLDFKPQTLIKTSSAPLFIQESEQLIQKMRKMSPKKIAAIMDINPKLADLNYLRFQQWQPSFTPENSKQAALSFNGDVYTGLSAKTLKPDDLEYAQNKLLILSGLHGILRPLDLIHPYRLEMGTEVKIGRSNNLYSFWSSKITGYLNTILKSHKRKVIINLASNEYSEVLDRKNIDAEFIDIDFKEFKADQYQIFFVFLKRARGLMARYIIQNRIEKPEDIKGFDLDRYEFNDRLSKKNNWVFTR
jgi:cytoplasmic iron level regulating protein YaaA (DUF328/UPF0246 family)